MGQTMGQQAMGQRDKQRVHRITGQWDKPQDYGTMGQQDNGTMGSTIGSWDNGTHYWTAGLWDKLQDCSYNRIRSGDALTTVYTVQCTQKQHPKPTEGVGATVM